MANGKRLRSEFVAIATIAFSAAGIAACDGGPGKIPSGDLTTYSPAPADNAYARVVDPGPPLSEGNGLPGNNPGSPPAAGKGGSNSGKGGSDSGKGGSDTGPTATCDDVVAAFEKCPEIGAPAASVKSLCTPYTNACKACVAKLDCEDLLALAQAGGKAEQSACANDCVVGTDGGPGGTGGSSSGKGGTGGTGGSSSGKGGTGGTGGTGGGTSGDCGDKLFSKLTECDIPVDLPTAQSVCEDAPSCQPCVEAVPCTSIETACSSACGLE